MDLKTKSEIFDVLYTVAERTINRYKPCGFKDGVCVHGKQNGCCGGFKYGVIGKWHHTTLSFTCQYLDESQGCTIQCLGCKLFYCTCGSRQIPGLTEKESMLLYNEMATIHAIAIECGIDVACFLTKEGAIGGNLCR